MTRLLPALLFAATGCVAGGTLGPDGGTVDAGGALLSLPAGALGADVAVELAPWDGRVPAAAASTAWRVSPEDLVLDAPGTLTLDAADTPYATLGRLEGNEFFPVPTLSDDAGVVGTIDRFGVYVAVAGEDADGDGVPTPADCDDTDPDVSPEFPELPDDGVDNDCDGRVDEFCDLPAAWADDGYPVMCPEFEDYQGDEGGVPGMGLPPFTMVDQNGVELDFRRLLGTVVAVEVAAEWCGPCRQTAEVGQATSDAMQALGPSYLVTVMAQDFNGGPADLATAQRWATEFGLEHPVLAAEESPWAFQDVAVFALPTWFLLRPDGTVDFRTEGSSFDVVAEVDRLLTTYADDLRPLPDFPPTD